MAVTEGQVRAIFYAKPTMSRLDNMDAEWG